MIGDRNVRLSRLLMIWELRERQARFQIMRKQAEHEHLADQLGLAFVETETLANEVQARAALDQKKIGRVDGAGRLALDRLFQVELAHRLLDSRSLLDQRQQREIASRNELSAQRLKRCHLQVKLQFLQKSVDRNQCKP